MTVAAVRLRAQELDDRHVLATAWLGTLLLSRLPEIVIREGLGVDATWMPIGWVLTAAALVLVSWRLSGLRALRGYFTLLGGVIVLTAIIDPWVRDSQAWRGVVSAAGAPMIALLAERGLLIALALVLVGVLALVRARPRYLAVGNLRAPSGFQLPWIARSPWSWMVVGPLAAVIFALLTMAAAASLLPSVQLRIDAALPLLGIALIAAALNAFAEEFLYRAAPLSQLAPAIGTGQAVLLLAIWFGLGHFYGGIPSGAIGAVQAGAVGLLFGKAMIDTRGLVWPWILHFSIDAVIYGALALSAASGV